MKNLRKSISILFPSVLALTVQTVFAGSTPEITIYSQPANGSTPAYQVHGFCTFKQPPSFTTKASCGGSEVSICVASVTCSDMQVTSGTTSVPVGDADVTVTCNASSCQHGVAMADTGYDASPCVKDKDFSQDSALKQIGGAAGSALGNSNAGSAN